MGFYPDDVAVSAVSIQHPGAPAEKHLAKLKKQNKTKIAEEMLSTAEVQTGEREKKEKTTQW